jgi:hypothetical protein
MACQDTISIVLFYFFALLIFLATIVAEISRGVSWRYFENRVDDFRSKCFAHGAVVFFLKVLEKFFSKLAFVHTIAHNETPVVDEQKPTC